ncbi:winged helix-turn-helix transcriptional regulator [Catenulispora sp. NF23]|uniref:MarR family winged helix-turn-helix transcriptional regulator n=1 Tax=Catenulispora pinistramenti TaxID=2705254 RepID=UPI001BA499B8|nr:MarR family winged helix-turn-helix transcriptional regulator [Catenulispora pinistramenti]MBS2533345.1 winged helix-turn-helix transcriptional regulator [Catenulispora pinistramenti]
MSQSRPDPETEARRGDRHDDDGPLDPVELRTLIALMDSVNLLHFHLEQQLRATADISFVQFQLLVRLRDAGGTQRMTQLADGVVYSRSGMTYQASLLEKLGLITRCPDPADARATAVALTDAGHAVLLDVLPGHVQLARRLLFDALTSDDLPQLAEIMTRVGDHQRAQPPRSADSLRRRGDNAEA